MKIKNKMYIWLIIGLSLRLILMLVGFHDDLRAIVFGGYLVVKQGRLFSFYDYLSSLTRTNPLVKTFGRNLFIYPPLAYLIPGLFIFILSPIINFNFVNQYILNPRQYLGTFKLMRHLFIFKLPYLVFDLGVAYLLTQLFKKHKKKLLAIWMLNPVTLYASFAMGQLDIFPVFFTVLAIYLALKRNKKQLALTALGIGGAFKLFPLLLIPIFTLVLEKDFWERLKLILIGLVSYALIVSPYLLISPGFRKSALLAKQTNKMLYMQLPVTASEGLPLFTLIYFLILLWAYFQKSVFSKKEMGLWTGGFSVLGLFYSLTHYHPQWFLWFTPFLIWLWVKYKQKVYLPIILILIGFGVHLIFFNPSLHLGILSGGFRQLRRLKTMKSLFTFPASFWRNTFRAVSTASILYLISVVTNKAKK